MPPILASDDGYGSPSWNTAPYSSRPRQRTTSLRDDIATSSKKKLPHMHSSSSYLPEYLSTSLPSLRRNSGSGSSEESSASSWESSQPSAEALSQPTSYVDSPNPMAIPHRASFPTKSFSNESYEAISRRALRPRRPSLAVDLRSSSRRPSILEGLSRADSSDGYTGMQVDGGADPSLTLPRPWLVDREQSSSSLRRLSEPSNEYRLRPRSPQESYPTLPGAPQLPPPISSLPTDMPKAKFVEGLVGAACIAVEVVWKVNDEVQMINGLPTPTVSPTSRAADSNVLPLRHFIKEVLRRSRSTCSTLQTALYYIHKSRDAIRARVRASEEARYELARLKADGNFWNPQGLPSPPFDDEDVHRGTRLTPKMASALLQKTRDPVVCGRRMFLAALICASKFLQDRTYSNRAWAKISSLPVQEINVNEKVFLELLGYNLFVNADLFKNWTRRLQELAEKQERKNSSLSGSGMQIESLNLPKPSLPLPNRDGLIRSSSEYMPPPAQTLELKPSLPGFSQFPPTPITPKDFSTSPERYRYTPPALAHGGLQRSHTDPRFEGFGAGQRLPSLGASAGKLPLPTLSLKIPYVPPSPSPLSGSRDEDMVNSAPHKLSSKPLLSKRYNTALQRTLSIDTHGLPRPSLSRKPSAACGSGLSRFAHSNNSIESNTHWLAGEDRMVS